MALNDQKMRKKWQESEVWNNKIDKKNTRELKIIVHIYGWSTIDLVGKKASKNAWLLVQHADHDIKFQKYCLNLMKRVFNENEKNIAKENLAFLKDRVLVNENKKQLFGTQFYKSKKGKFVLRPIVNKRDLQKRRNQYGLPPIEEYLKFAEVYNKKSI